MFTEIALYFFSFKLFLPILFVRKYNTLFRLFKLKLHAKINVGWKVEICFQNFFKNRNHTNPC